MKTKGRSRTAVTLCGDIAVTIRPALLQRCLHRQHRTRTTATAASLTLTLRCSFIKSNCRFTVVVATYTRIELVFISVDIENRAGRNQAARIVILKI